jgi:uracil-DNA glycosylase
MDNCSRFLDREFELLDRLRVVVALGRIAWDAALRRSLRVARESMPRPRPRFGHGKLSRLALRRGRALWLLGSYHPSQRNTQTGRLTRPMLDGVIRRAVALARGGATGARVPRESNRTEASDRRR